MHNRYPTPTVRDQSVFWEYTKEDEAKAKQAAQDAADKAKFIEANIAELQAAMIEARRELTAANERLNTCPPSEIRELVRARAELTAALAVMDARYERELNTLPQIERLWKDNEIYYRRVAAERKNKA